MIPRGSARDFSYKVASLCIYYGVEALARRNRYLEATISCKWDSVEVARVDIDQTSLPENIDPQTPSTKNTTLTARSPDVITPEFHIRSRGNHLNYISVMITLMNAFMLFSSVGQTELAPHSSIEADARYDVCLTFKPNDPAPSEPPYFNYRVVIESLRLMPDFMIQRMRFAELDVTFLVNGIGVGSGALVRGYAPQGGRVGGNATLVTA